MRRGGPEGPPRAVPSNRRLYGCPEACPVVLAGEAFGRAIPERSLAQAQPGQVFDVFTIWGMDAADRAREFASNAYDSSEELEHPSEVAALVDGAGGSDEQVVAALLHDLVEDTDVDLPAIRSEFGAEVERLVRALTEDESLDDYLERKQEARLRARDAGPEAALIFVADKLSNARRMRRARKQPQGMKLAHYAATAKLMRESFADLPLIPELEAELDAIRRELGRLPA